MDATEIRSKVDELLAAANVTFSVRLVGETVRDNDWKCDAWRVSFKPANGRAWETDYFTGLGLRAKPKFPEHHIMHTPGKPQAPKAADVLYSLILDARADEVSFRDWCDEYGSSDDSLKALDTYRACCDIAVKLRTVFRPETLAALREAVQDL